MAAPKPPFQAFTAKSNGTIDRVITELEVFPGFDPAVKPRPAGVRTRALWDTGATRSVISAGVAKSLGLAPVGKTNVNHAGGAGESPTYLVSFGLPQGVLVGGIIASEFGAAPGFGAIVGMDVICLGDFSITNVGRQTLVSFRIPSWEAIDYVSEANKFMYAGTKRNAPCPCGAAGKKFKHCHGA